jgi:hypothetical protein
LCRVVRPVAIRRRYNNDYLLYSEPTAPVRSLRTSIILTELARQRRHERRRRRRLRRLAASA